MDNTGKVGKKLCCPDLCPLSCSEGHTSENLKVQNEIQKKGRKDETAQMSLSVHLLHHATSLTLVEPFAQCREHYAYMSM